MINSKKFMKGLLGASALTTLSAGTAFAQVTTPPNDFTPAGTSVSNTFTLDYSVGGVTQPPIDSSDPSDPNGPTLFTVDRLINLTVETQGDTNVAPGATNEDLVFSVLNTGNDTQGYALTVVEETGDDFDTDAPTSTTPLLVFIDDGDGVFEPGAGAGQDGVGVPYDPANPPQLGPDEALFVVVQQDIPTSVIDGQVADISLVADTLDAGTTTPTVGDADGNALEGAAENVLADGTSTANELANEGDDSATGTFIVAAADVEALKTVSIFSENGANCSTIPGTPTGGFGVPGSCVEYVITATNSGSQAATDITVNDILPPELEFSAAIFGGNFTGGSFASPALPAAGTDCTGGACVVNLTGATLPAPIAPATTSVGTVTIRAIVK